METLIEGTGISATPAPPRSRYQIAMATVMATQARKFPDKHVQDNGDPYPAVRNPWINMEIVSVTDEAFELQPSDMYWASLPHVDIMSLLKVGYEVDDTTAKFDQPFPANQVPAKFLDTLGTFSEDRTVLTLFSSK